MSDDPSLPRFSRAVVVFDEWCARCALGRVESFDALLARHPQLVAFLEPMRPADEGPGDPPATVATGDRILNFELLELLGEGGQAEVWKARDTDLDRLVALKVFHVPAPEGSPQRARFEREARAAARLEHPHLCRVLAHGEWRRRYWIALQFLDGDNLESRLPPRSKAERRAQVRGYVAMARDLADALAHAHARDLVHRDVKPSNIVFAAPADDGGPERAVLIDFGIVQALDRTRETLPGLEAGTPLYMSPEQLLGTRAIDARTDVFALGLTLFRCLTDQLPFSAASNSDYRRALQAHREPDVRQVREDFGRDLAAVLGKALALDPDERYATASDLTVDLERWLKGEPVQARRPGVGRRLLRFTRRHPARSTAAAALVALLALGIWTGAREVQAAVREREYRAAQATVDARLRSSVGQWAEALDALARAAAAGQDERIVALERAQILLAQVHYEESRAILTQLRDRQDLGDLADLVALLWFDPTTPDSGPMDGWADEFQRLSMSPRLTDAWRAYARACLAPTLPDTVESCETVLAVDPRHRSAHELRLSALVLSGSAEQLAAAATEFALAWPDDSFGWVTKALALAMSDQPVESQRAIERITDDDIRFSTEELIELFLAARAETDEARNKLCAAILRNKPGFDWEPGRTFMKAQQLARCLEDTLPLRMPRALTETIPKHLKFVMPALITQALAHTETATVVPDLDELGRTLGMPSFSMIQAVSYAATGRPDATVQVLRETSTAGDWVSSRRDLEIWRCMALAAAVAQPITLRQQPSDDAVDDLRRAITDAMDSEDGASVSEETMVAYASVLTRDPLLIGRCAAWLRQRHPDDLYAKRVAGLAFAHAGHRERALELVADFRAECPEEEVAREFERRLLDGSFEPLRIELPEDPPTRTPTREK